MTASLTERRECPPREQPTDAARLRVMPTGGAVVGRVSVQHTGVVLAGELPVVGGGATYQSAQQRFDQPCNRAAILAVKAFSAARSALFRSSVGSVRIRMWASMRTSAW